MRRAQVVSLGALVLSAGVVAVLVLVPRVERRGAVAPGRCAISGSVHLEGRPVVAVVEAWRVDPYAFGEPERERELVWREPYGGEPDAVGLADARGRFDLTGLPPGRWRIRATGEAPGSPVGWSVASVPVEGARDECVIDAAPSAGLLHVLVERADLKRCGARVIFARRSTRFDMPCARVVAEVGADHAGIAEDLTAGWWGVTVVADDLRMEGLSVRMPHPEGGLNLQLPPTPREVTGVVVDAIDGRPIEGARVEVSGEAENDGPFVAVSGRTGLDGAFRVAAPARSWSLDVEADGYGARSVSLAERTADLRVRLRPVARVRGVVVAAGTRRGLAGMRVVAQALESQTRPPSGSLDHGAGATVTDEQGRYSMEVAETGEIGLIAYGSGWFGRAIPVAVTAGREFVADVEAGRAAHVHGVVRDAQGMPVQGAVVRVREDVPQPSNGVLSDLEEMPDAGIAVATDAQGRFACDTVVPGLALVIQAAVGGAGGRFLPARSLAPDEDKEIALAAPPKRTVTVRVVDADGAPVVGAEVRTGTVVRERAWTGAGGLVRFSNAWWSSEVGVRPPAGEGRTVPLPPVPDEPAKGADVAVTVRLGADEEEWQRPIGIHPPLRHPAPQERASRPERETTRTIRVLSADGRPVGTAGGTATWEGSPYPAPVEDGEMKIAVRREIRLTLHVFRSRAADGGPDGSGPLAAGPFEPGAIPQEIRLPPEHTISGRVALADGTPVRGARLVAAPPSTRWGEEARSAWTDADGHFVVRGLGRGSHRLEAWEQGYAADSLTVESGRAGFSWTWRKRVTAAVHVLDPEGRPVAGARVHAWVGDDEVSDVTDEAGIARLSDLDPATACEIAAAPPRGRREEWPAPRVEEWTPAATTLRFTRRRVVSGVIRSPAGEPLPEASLRWRIGEPGKPIGVDADGRFAAWFDTDDEVELLASFEDAEDGSPPVTLRVRPDAKDLVVTVPTGTFLRVRFDPVPTQDRLAGEPYAYLAPDGEPLDPERRPRLRRAVAGEFRWFGLRADRTYSVWLSTPSRAAFVTGLRAALSPVVVPTEAARSIHGRVVVQAPGTPSMHVNAVRGPARVSGTQCTSDGRFRIDGLPQGRWRIEGEADDAEGGRYEGTAEAETGGSVDVLLLPVPHVPARPR